MYHKDILPNGIRVVTEEIKGVRSCSVGVWVNVGSKDEDQTLNGISHFIEHMVFKGTANRTAHEIAETMDGVGGQLGAFTSREYTCYHVKVAKEHLYLALELLADMFLNSTFDEAEVKKEKRVVQEEIKMYEDTPDELIHDLFTKTIYQDHSLGRPVIGTSGAIRRLNREEVIRFFSARYTPERVVISVAGRITHQDVLKKVRELFGNHKTPSWSSTMHLPQVRARFFGEERDLEQVHLCLGGEGLAYTSEDRYVLSLLNGLLGGSMSSRLFEEVREKRGLAYAIYSYHSSFRDCGLFAVYVGTSRRTCHQTIRLILKELTRLKQDRVSEKELEKTKEHLKGGLILDLEDTGNRMGRLAKQEIYFNRYIPIDEILKETSRVTPAQIQELARRLFQPQALTLASIGPLSAKELKEIDLTC